MTTTSAILTIFVYGLMSALLGAALPSYGLTQSQQGHLALANALGLVIASLCAGPFLDWKGKKAALVIGMSIIGIALIAAANALALLTTYFVLGIGGGIVTTGANSLVSDISPERRGAALNFANLFFGLGGVITTYAASYLLSPRNLCYSIACLAAIVLAVSLKASIIRPSDKAPLLLRRVPALLSNPTLIGISLLLFFYVACEVGVWNWLKLYLISIQYPPSTAGGIVSYGFAMGMLVGRVGVSRFLSKRAAMPVIIAASLLIMVTTLLMLHVSSQAAVTLVVFFAGISMAPVFPTALALVGDHFPDRSATATGIAVTFGWVGLASSSPLIGSLAAGHSLGRALLLLPASAAAMVLVSLVLAIRLRRGLPT